MLATATSAYSHCRTKGLLRKCRIPTGILVAFLSALVFAQSTYAAPLEGQIVVDQDRPAWLKYHLGGPHFLAGPGDPEDFLYRGTRNADGTRSGDQDALIDKLAASGANSIYMQIVRSNGGDGDATHNPFIDNDPAKGLNDAVLEQWEGWFQRMDQNGIVIFLFFYDDSSLVWNTGDNVGAEERAFIQTIVNRFENFKNLIWVVAEEYQEVYSTARVSAIAAEIRAADNRNHPVAVHKLAGLDFSDLASDPYVDQFAIQLNDTDPDSLHNSVVTAWAESGGRYNNNMSESPSWGTGAEARKKAWAVAMGGAYVMALGMSIADTPTSDLEDLGRLVSFMEATKFDRMAPRDDLALGDTKYVMAAAGDVYIAYSAGPSANLGISSLDPGSYSLRWFNPVTGAQVNQTYNSSGGAEFWTKPASMGAEVALYVEKLAGTTSSAKSYPGASWEFRDPAALGLDSSTLDQLIGRVGGSGCIARNGYMARCWGDTSGNYDWASAAKPVLSTLLFFAVSEGRLASVDDRVADWGWNLNAKDSSMTFRHLANMLSGYARGESPGQAWAYNDFAINLYAKTLEQIFGTNLDTAARSRLSALQFEDGSIFGTRGGLGVNASIRDFARIAWLWANHGEWDGVQILPARFFDDYVKPYVSVSTPRTSISGSDYLGVGTYGGDSDQIRHGPGIYGFNWWFNGMSPSGRHWPDAPLDTYQANGHWGGEVVIVMPSLGIVVAALGNWGTFETFSPGDASAPMNINLKLLADAVVGDLADTVAPEPPTDVTVR